LNGKVVVLITRARESSDDNHALPDGRMIDSEGRIVADAGDGRIQDESA